MLRFGAGLLPQAGARMAMGAKEGDWKEIELDLSALTGIVSFEPADQVVVVRAGMTFEDLNQALASEGQCLPLDSGNIGSPYIGTALGLNLPHALEAQCGTWRDWILGLTIVQADGTVAKCGSKAVKNVAGYDVQKLFIGARDSLGVVAEVILRTYPARALPSPNLLPGPEGAQEELGDGIAPSQGWGRATHVQRVLCSQFAEALKTGTVIFADRETCTLWHSSEPKRFESDWLIPLHGPATFTDSAQRTFMRRAKDLFDPTHKLNPGVMGPF